MALLYGGTHVRTNKIALSTIMWHTLSRDKELQSHQTLMIQDNLLVKKDLLLLLINVQKLVLSRFM